MNLPISRPPEARSSMPTFEPLTTAAMFAGASGLLLVSSAIRAACARH